MSEEKYLMFDKQLSSVKTSTSETLAAHIVAYRGIGINKEIAIACMEELINRRNNGDSFEFETYIDEKVSLIPKLKGIDYAKIIRGMTNDR